MRVAINGFGRIGRNVLRAILQDPKAREILDVVAINIGPARPDAVAHMFKYDTLMGTFPGNVSMENDYLIVNGKKIRVLQECDPKLTNWSNDDIDWVIESSGQFTKREGATKHLDAGAQYVLISAPAKGEDVAIIPGVNEEKFNPEKDRIVSLGSCTTNAFIPLLKVLNDNFGIQQGLMTTIHAYTNTQVLLDVEDSDLRRSRAAALNIIPTTTGAAKMLGKVLPELESKVSAVAVRVPVAKVSLIDLSVITEKPTTVEKIHHAFEKASKEKMKGIVTTVMEPLVSSDFSCSPYSVIVDGLLTQAQNKLCKIFGWYDNEWGYSERLKDFLMYAASLEK